MFFIIISFFGSERPEALSVAKGDGSDGSPKALAKGDVYNSFVFFKFRILELKTPHPFLHIWQSLADSVYC